MQDKPRSVAPAIISGVAHHSHPFAGQRRAASRCGRNAPPAPIAIVYSNTTKGDNGTGHSPCLKRGACREDKLPNPVAVRHPRFVVRGVLHDSTYPYFLPRTPPEHPRT